ncbi:proton-coupled amino acid transporter-like protein CG1139 isoform X3 [Euwallacea fornicatus]|uniref:proton-coupled amino acid transporter-like protein CG1139 isoform X3 n=2 Tax=Euwallacea fornicatus TaxID=995702 RepID=UPI00338D6DC5
MSSRNCNKNEWKYEAVPRSESSVTMASATKSFSAAINSREQLTPKANAHTYAIELSELKRKEAGAYDPYDHSDIEHPTTNFETLIHLLKSSFGTGILAMPLAFYHSGYVLGIIGTAFIGLLCTYCMHMLVRTEYELCKRKKVPSLTYPGTAEAALSEGPAFLAKLAPYSGGICYTFLLIYQLGSCCVYVVFVGQNISYVINSYTEIHERLVMVMILLPLILITFVRNLKLLAPFTTVANGITVVSFGIIYYYIFKENISLENRMAMGELKNYPLFFGTVMFALESIGMVLPLQQEMKNRAHFSQPLGTLNIGMTLVVVLYITTGLFGYLAYGEHVGGSISYTISPGSIAAQVCKILLALAIYTSFSLFMYVGFDIIWNHLHVKEKFDNKRNPTFWEYLFRTLLVCIVFGLAVLIPYIDLFISLVGALCISALGLAFPAIFDSSTRWHHLAGWQKYWVHLKNVIIVLFALFGLAVGTATSMEQIIEKFTVPANSTGTT